MEVFSGQSKLVAALIDEFGVENIFTQNFDYDMTFAIKVKVGDKVSAIRLAHEFDDTPKKSIEYDYFFQFYRKDYSDTWEEVYDPHWEKQRTTPYNWKKYLCDNGKITLIVDGFKEILNG